MDARQHNDDAVLPIVQRAYDRSRLTPGIVHLGLGGFARAHLAAYVHDLMLVDASATRWGIVGVGLRAADRPLLTALAAEDHLYTLVERDADGERRSVIGSLIGTIDASGDAKELLQLAASPGVALLSLTVTERGYCLGGDRRLDLLHPAIARDLSDPGAPRSPIGLVAAILARRRDTGAGGLTVLSCDNIQHNGAVLRAAVLDYAAALDPDLATWIDAAAVFPNAMVDRITPRPDPSTPTVLVCEPFRQWVLEDRAAGDFPALGRVGVQLVADVAPYERMKLWLLNASHLALAGPAELLGIPTVAEAMACPEINHFIRALMARETMPAVGDVAGIDLPAYADDLLRRFANPAIPDTPSRINADAPISYLLDPLRAIRSAGKDAPLLIVALAFWLHRLRAHDHANGPAEIEHAPVSELQRLTSWRSSGTAFPLKLDALLGDFLDDQSNAEALLRSINLVSASGAQLALSIACSLNSCQS